ncbi:flagella synthesis protein FlgN [Chromobacterium sp. IIBBL 290-4]|uniref:flagella synthesis protein FlgN n=1 Tax=Chromobacterium sp. IIBBL 290-4 TaxID=2953890 RepID=UPI0020B86F88|nr:flagellar protein FlgN [Chromobacterium sp. IIBBL 290-4]UTH75059.1 flagellar protein FlgN [Chromobacterium sp. IIBBL 290-4]
MPVVEEFSSLCRAESELVSRLIALLEQEQQFLIQGDDLKLAPLADSKSEVLDLLAAQSAKRGELMRSFGVQDRDTLYIWLADKPAACEAWMQLEDQVSRAQSINLLNGQFVHQKLERVEESLTVLREAASATLGYGRDGERPELVTGRRFLGSA